MKVLNKILDFILGILFIGLVICVFLQVFSRYLLPISLPWTEELARFIFIYITFLGAAIALREQEHIIISVVFDKLSDKFRYSLRIIINFMIFGFLYFVFKGILQMIPLTWEVASASMDWLMVGYIYMSLPIAIIFMCIYLGVQTYRIFNKLLDSFAR